MISREQLKQELDFLDETTINVLHHVIMVLKQNVSISNNETNWLVNNPLKNSVIYEKDIIRPIDEDWDVEQ
ncbi:hypothetical protein [Gloeocapsa sp. PCC 73106]|uniref:hypothetical protein n=1 Tax=Gloeocapsa sp. PCC 73106 TaxID=102232 RepID=UPI0002ABB6BB|nr:hypothetical protein [Gloeocapsa sp. PCC 73106]ELS00052.1 hypothetical protein GLO73106DRAFT_00039050 [Gloeocapsa sp. PCC 73106]